VPGTNFISSRERVKAGCSGQKEKGTHVGRLLISEEKREGFHKLKTEGVSINQISKKLGVASGTDGNYA